MKTLFPFDEASIHIAFEFYPIKFLLVSQQINNDVNSYLFKP